MYNRREKAKEQEIKRVRLSEACNFSALSAQFPIFTFAMESSLRALKDPKLRKVIFMICI